MSKKYLLFLVAIALTACETKPKVAASVEEMKMAFYSLNHSSVVGYRCEVTPKTLSTLSDSEMDYVFQQRFKRDATLQEKGMLRRLKWSVTNSSQAQEASPSPKTKEFPTNESADAVGKLTYLMTLANKVFTLIYLENFSDRQDLKQVEIGDKFYTVTSFQGERAAEVEFNLKKYRIFFGERPDSIEVTIKRQEKMGVPEMVQIQTADNKATIFPHFVVREGFAQISDLSVEFSEIPGVTLQFPFTNCEYLHLSSSPTTAP